MQDIMIRIQTDDFEAWKEQHYLHAANRARYGITDGPAYRDLDDPGAALFHISVQDMDTAMGWFRSDTFKEATTLAKVTSRSFYLAQPQTSPPGASPGTSGHDTARQQAPILAVSGASCREARMPAVFVCMLSGRHR